MNLAEGGGGGGAPSSYVVDRATLTAVASGLGEAASTLDSAGQDRPGAGGTGQAEPLLLMILAAASEAGARMAYEASVLAAAVEDCNVDAASVDSNEAAAFLVRGLNG